MKPLSGSRIGFHLLLAGLLLALPSGAQVPQDTTFSGRLVDGGGTPLAGPVTIELWLYDADAGGTALYAEEHASVPLDTQGGFAVLLGTGADAGGPFPPFDDALFSDVERYVEVRIGVETLTPRVPISSVPWAFVSQQANRIVLDPGADFVDCGDGTVADPRTGLLWEKKTGSVTGPVVCETNPCPDPHDVNNLYEWSNSGIPPDGNAFTDFLAMLNDPQFGTALNDTEVTGCLAGYCDWRLPNIVELRTILDCSFGSPCIDPIFGPTTLGNYWSASTVTSLPVNGFWQSFNQPLSTQNAKTLDEYVRAVRKGSCN